MKRDRRLERFCKLKTVTNINFEDSRYLPVHNVTNITVCRKIFLVPKTSLSPNQSISNPIKESEMKFIVAAIILITIIRVEKADFEKFYMRKNINSVKNFATLAIITTIVEFSAFHTALANEGFFSSSSFNQYFSIR